MESLRENFFVSKKWRFWKDFHVKEQEKKKIVMAAPSVAIKKVGKIGKIVGWGGGGYSGNARIEKFFPIGSLP